MPGLPGIQAFRRLPPDSLPFGISDGRADRTGQCRRDAVLSGEPGSARFIVAVAPNMSPGLGINQLDVDPNLARVGPYAAFQHVIHAQLSPDPSHVQGAALVPLVDVRSPGDHGQATVAHEGVYNVSCQSICEQIVLPSAA